MSLTFTTIKLFLFFVSFAKAQDTDYLIDIVQQYLDDVFTNSDSPSQCATDLRILLQDAQEYKLWALKMLDSSGRPGTGILAGNVRAEGSYDQCLSVRNTDDTIRGKYCMAALMPVEEYQEQLKFMSNVADFAIGIGAKYNRRNVTDASRKIRLSSAFCVPDSCLQADLEKISNFTVEELSWKIKLLFSDSFCTTGEGVPFSSEAIFAIVVYIIYAALLTISTTYDVLVYQKNGLIGNKILVAFSLHTNFHKLFSMVESTDYLSCINGLRVISMAWIILGHTFMYNAFFPNINGMYIFEWKDNLWNSFVFAAPLAVDTFFGISGLLLVYGYLNIRMIKRLDVPVTAFYLHRIIRLTPALAATILFYAGLLSYMGDGPYWFGIPFFQQENCKKYWWSTLLYIQNYYNSTNECVGQSWYLAVDTQLYFLSPIFLIPMIKHPKRTLIAVFIVYAASTLTAFFVTIEYRIGAIPIDAGKDYFDYIYYRTHIRMTPWLVGAVWGYVLYKAKSRNFVLNRKVAIIGWCISLPTMIYLILLHVALSSYEFNVFTAALFNAFVRPLWTAGVGWVIFACVNGRAGVVNNFLTLPIFGVLAKLSYSMFLTHLPLLLIVKTRQRQSAYFSNFVGCVEFWSFYTITLIISAVWSLAFESPALALEKIIFEKDVPRSEETTRNNFSNNLGSMRLTLESEEKIQ